MTFTEELIKSQSYKLTENGALAFNTSEDNIVDLFSECGAMRQRNEEDIERMFMRAMAEDHLLTTKLAFYTRDIKEGLGERRTGRIMLKTLAIHYPEIFKKNMHLISEYGRWDDLVFLLDFCPEIIEIIREQLNKDKEDMKSGKAISLLAKWLPSVNTSSKETNAKGKKIAGLLGMSEKEYRKTLAAIRKYLNVTEVNMSRKEYANIDYSEVPSKAMNNYRNAFIRNDEARFFEFLNKVEKGEAKINSSVLFPYDITEKYLYQVLCDDPVLEEQWKALPNYVEGENNFLIMADVSGSMFGRPMATSVGLALYFAERNKGAFANTFMTFSSRPELVSVKGENLFDKLCSIMAASWEMNTNLEAAFNLVLNTAVSNHTDKKDMPTSIVVITDMEIDECAESDWSFYELMKQRFEKNGYEIPNIVFWNVNARHETFHASFNRPGVQLASGQSATVFQSLVSGISLTPYEYMDSVLNAPRYEAIQV